jgi:hypothetical protein
MRSYLVLSPTQAGYNKQRTSQTTGYDSELPQDSTRKYHLLTPGPRLEKSPQTPPTYGDCCAELGAGRSKCLPSVLDEKPLRLPFYPNLAGAVMWVPSSNSHSVGVTVDSSPQHNFRGGWLVRPDNQAHAPTCFRARARLCAGRDSLAFSHALPAAATPFDIPRFRPSPR